MNHNKVPFQPIKVDLSKCNSVVCQNVLTLNDEEIPCGSIHFIQAFVIKVISPLMSPTGQNQLHPLPAFLCANCGFPIGMIPKKKGEKEDDKKTTEADNVPL